MRNLRLPAPLLGFVREDADEAIVCLFNFSAETVALNGARFLGSGLPGSLPPYGTAFAARTIQITPDLACAAD
jgi:hypothetical protein